MVRKTLPLAESYPALAGEWHPTKNGELTPEDVTPGSSKKVWWRCAAGHEWQAAVYSRVYGRGCPICAKEKQSPREGGNETNGRKKTLSL